MKQEWVQLQHDDASLRELAAIWRATDREKFPDEAGWDERDLAVLAQRTPSNEHRFLLVRGDDGRAVAGAMFNLPLLDNLHAAWTDIRVLPAHRRRGIGRALFDQVIAAATAEKRRVVNHISDIPVGQESSHPSTPFIEAMGFVPSHAGHRRSLRLPVDPARLSALRADVASAPGAGDYRVVRLLGPWPDRYVEDQCALERAMSTDQPLGDQEGEEEVWDAARVRDADARMAEQGQRSVVAAAEHVESGRLVAYSRIVVSDRRPFEAWQWATIVLKEHRGHRLGLAVKLANIDHLRSALPTARKVITSNAAVNGPMIAVNDLMGFEIDAVGQFWQKWLVDR